MIKIILKMFAIISIILGLLAITGGILELSDPESIYVIIGGAFILVYGLLTILFLRRKNNFNNQEKKNLSQTPSF